MSRIPITKARRASERGPAGPSNATSRECADIDAFESKKSAAEIKHEFVISIDS